MTQLNMTVYFIIIIQVNWYLYIIYHTLNTHVLLYYYKDILTLHNVHVLVVHDISNDNLSPVLYNNDIIKIIIII